MSVDRLKDHDKNIPVILATQRLLGPYQRLEKMGFQKIWPFSVFSILDSRQFQPHPFYDRILEDLFENRDQLKAFYHILGDDQSKVALDAVIGFRLTLQVKVLEECICPDPYMSKDIFSFSKTEVFVDGGAFNGDSIKFFIERCSGEFKKIISFEPSREPFKVLKELFGHDSRIELIQAFLCDRETTLLFDDLGQRDSSLIQQGQGNRVRGTNIDGLPDSAGITFIKMNIEGAERDALQGARKTIQKQAPKLAIAAYHRPSDLWALPKLIKELNPKYKLYLRQHDGGIIETVLYAK